MYVGSNPTLPTNNRKVVVLLNCSIRFVGLNGSSGSSSIGRAIAFQAIGREFDPRLPLNWFCRCSSVVEHFLGREEVVSSILTNGSNRLRQNYPVKAGKVVGVR